MPIQVLQKPSDVQSAQSPIVFSVITSGSEANAYTASGFQYTANLYIWSGTTAQSGSYLYQSRKYPNTSGSGIFDFSKMINSTLTDLSAENGSNLKFYKVDFGFQYESGSSYVTQSGALTSVSCSVGGTLFKAYDGYSLFPEQINTSLYSGSNGAFPIMSDMWTVTQSVLENDVTKIGAASTGTSQRGISYFRGQSDNVIPNLIAITASYTTGTKISASLAIAQGTTTAGQIQFNGSAPGDGGWPFYGGTATIPLTNLDTYVFNTYSGSLKLGPSVNYEVVCKHYYEPVRIAYKNRYGQFDFINFYKRHDNQFNTEQRIYQPQLGSWQSSTLSYNGFQTRQQRYIVDATEVITCNTDFLQEGYNELIKQLLVSDEIYWLYENIDVNGDPGGFDSFTNIKPLTIQTNSLQFKTGVNNKLIQYTITFDIGQPYKLIL
jgi:hypothetical protein